nr:hypothetical protein [Megavirus caiporensis]
MEQNILTSEFYKHLTVVLYNGPPETIYGKFSDFTLRSGNEKTIIKAIQECEDKTTLYKNIINPSDNVTIAYLKEEYFGFKNVKNPSKPVIKFAIVEYNEIFDKYKHLFNYQETLELIEKSPWIIKYIESPTIEQYKMALSKDGFVICCIENQTLELCKMALKQIINDDHCYAHGTILKNMKHIDDKMIDLIIDSKFLLHEFKNIPKKFLNLVNIEKIIKNCPMCLKDMDNKLLTQELCELAFDRDIKSVQYIPHIYQTEYMTDKIKLGKYYNLIPYIKNLDREYCNQMFQDSLQNIKFIPHEYQSKEMCIKAIEYHYTYLKYCAHIDDEILNIIFKSKCMANIPKKDRFKFILDFDDNIIIKIIRAEPNLLSIIPENRQSDEIVKQALATNGWSLQYVINKKEEYVKIALENQPMAVKYAN